MSRFTLKQLRYFVALAQHRHFGRAAAACSISQPALSVQIKELEETLGISLFERGARQLRLTTIGDALLLRAQDILKATDEFSDLARASRSEALDRLRIGVIPTIAPYLLPTLIGNLTHLHPGLDLHVRETLTPKLLLELSEGKIDAAIVALPVSEPSFTETPLFDEDFVLVRHRNDHGMPVPDGSDLRKMRLLLLEEGHCFRDQALSFCNVQSDLPREGLDGSSLTTLVQMVAAGIGVTLIPEMALDVETSSAKVSISRFANVPPSRTIGMIWRKTNPLAERFTHVAEVVRQSAENLRSAK
jgi:LysR family hydrogen peroxide-inducible transcriptional activator